MEWAGSLDEYEKLVIRMNTPRVVMDNAVCPTATLVKVDSARKHGLLLEAVQVLTDLNLSIRKAYISSDGRWFMDVFHVTDHLGHKLTDHSLLSYIEESLGAGNMEKTNDFEGLTALELIGTDRPGLLSEVFAVLANLECTVVEAKVWTHIGRIASLIFLQDDDSNSPLTNPHKIHRIESRLQNILRGNGSDALGAKTAVCAAATHPDRRLHQMMFADRDYERVSSCASVSVQNWVERGYSVVTVQCRDRPKLLFDVVCTLTDMEYIVFHGTIDTNGDQAHQEFYLRHSDGSPISSEAERQRVIQCLQAAVARRASKGLRLELCTEDRRGLLSDVTRTFRENGLVVTRAEVSTKGCMASNVFYVTEASGCQPDPKVIDAVRQRIGMERLRVSEESPLRIPHKSLASGAREVEGGVGLFSLGSLVKRNLYNLGLIRSCS